MKKRFDTIGGLIIRSAQDKLKEVGVIVQCHIGNHESQLACPPYYIVVSTDRWPFDQKRNEDGFFTVSINSASTIDNASRCLDVVLATYDQPISNPNFDPTVVVNGIVRVIELIRTFPDLAKLAYEGRFDQQLLSAQMKGVLNGTRTRT